MGSDGLKVITGGAAAATPEAVRGDPYVDAEGLQIVEAAGCVHRINPQAQGHGSDDECDARSTAAGAESAYVAEHGQQHRRGIDGNQDEEKRHESM